MSNFFEVNRARLENFSRVSKAVGARADYVQGGDMAIKASGFCLKDIEPDKTYAVLDYKTLSAFYNGSDPADFKDVEKAGSSKAKEVTKTIEGLAVLRPSVEAGFHSVLDTYVAHSHSVYANLAACSVECMGKREIPQVSGGKEVRYKINREPRLRLPILMLAARAHVRLYSSASLHISKWLKKFCTIS